jgi:hypothetical protein
VDERFSDTMSKDPVYNILWGSWFRPVHEDLLARRHGRLGEKWEGRKSYIRFTTMVCITGSLVYHGIICFFSRNLPIPHFLYFLGGPIVILDGAELETGLRT